MKAFTFSTVVALAATSFAATVTLEQTACIQNGTAGVGDQFSVQVDKLTAIDLPTVCGLKIVSADGVDAKDVKCRAYRDAEGKEPGSKEFTVEEPAKIATNPVQEKAVLCIGSGDIPSSAVPTTFAVVSTSASPASPTGGASPSGGNSTTSAPTAGSPSATPSATGAPGEGAASTVGMSFGALSVAAFAMLLL